MIQANPHAPSDHMAVMRLAHCPQAEAPGLGVVARMKGGPCSRCGERTVEFRDPATGRVVASPPCDACLVSAVVCEVPDWQPLPLLKATGLDERPRVGIGQAFVHPGQAGHLPRGAWEEFLRRHQAGDWGELGVYAAGKPTDPESFAPEMASTAVRNRATCDSPVGVVRSRYTRGPGLTSPGAVCDVATLKAVGSRTTYARITDVMRPCFGLRI